MLPHRPPADNAGLGGNWFLADSATFAKIFNRHSSQDIN